LITYRCSDKKQHAYLQMGLPNNAEQSQSTYCQGFPQIEAKTATNRAQHGSYFSRHRINLLKNLTIAHVTWSILPPKGSVAARRRKEVKSYCFRDTTLSLVVLRQVVRHRCPSSREREIKHLWHLGSLSGKLRYKNQTNILILTWSNLLQK